MAGAPPGCAGGGIRPRYPDFKLSDNVSVTAARGPEAERPALYVFPGSRAGSCRPAGPTRAPVPRGARPAAAPAPVTAVGGPRLGRSAKRTHARSFGFGSNRTAPRIPRPLGARKPDCGVRPGGPPGRHGPRGSDAAETGCPSSARNLYAGRGPQSLPKLNIVIRDYMSRGVQPLSTPLQCPTPPH